MQLPYCWRGVALGRKYHHLRTSQLDQQNGISDGWPGGNFSNSSKTGPPDFSDKFLGMRQQHQIISRNNHDEHGTIGEHINTQWGLILFEVTFEFSLFSSSLSFGQKCCPKRKKSKFYHASLSWFCIGTNLIGELCWIWI